MAIWGEVGLPAEAWSWHKMETINHGFFEKEVPQQTEVPFSARSVRLKPPGGLVPLFSSFLAGEHGVEGHRGHQHEIPDLAP